MLKITPLPAPLTSGQNSDAPDQTVTAREDFSQLLDNASWPVLSREMRALHQALTQTASQTRVLQLQAQCGTQIARQALEPLSDRLTGLTAWVDDLRARGLDVVLLELYCMNLLRRLEGLWRSPALTNELNLAQKNPQAS